MSAQILLNLSVLVFGSVLIFPFSSRINTSLYVALAWFCGWTTIVILEILLVIAGVYVTIPKIAGCSAFCVIMLWIAARNSSITERMVFRRRELQRFFWQFTILLLLCILVIILLAYFGTYIWYSPDSLMIDGLSRMFHKYGVYGDGKLLYSGQAGVELYSLFGNILPFYVAIHNVAYLCGIEVFYSFMGTTTFFTCLALWGFWRGENDQFGFVSLIWLLLVLALFLSNKMVVLHSFYTLTNLTTMAYYTLGILSLYEYLNKKDYLWFMLACLFLGCTGILRIEMLIFSLLPFCFVGWKKCLPKLKITLLGFVLYFLFSYLWFCWGFLGLLGISEAITSGGWGTDGPLSAIAFGFVLSPIIFFFPWQTTNKRVRVAIYIILFISALFFVCYFNDKLMTSWNALYLLTAKGKGYWGSFWRLLFWGVCIYSLLRIMPVLLKILPFFAKAMPSQDDMVSQGSAKLSHGLGRLWRRLRLVNLPRGASPAEIEISLKANINGMDFLAFVLVAFFITRIILYGITEGPMDDLWCNSGNRILLHIYPVSVYFLGRIGFICTREIT